MLVEAANYQVKKELLKKVYIGIAACIANAANLSQQ